MFSKVDIDVIATVFERLPHGVSVMRLEDESDLGSFRFIEANPSASRQMGVDLSRVIGTTIRESLPDMLQTDWPQKCLEAIQTGEPVLVGEVEYPDGDVPEEHLTVTAVPLGGQYVAILFENASGRHHLQRELVEKSEEATRLSTLNEMVLELAHHVRNAITPISLLAELYDGTDAEVAAQLKKVAIGQTNRIAAIIDSFVEMLEVGDDSTTSSPSSKGATVLDMDALIDKHLERRLKMLERRRSGRSGASASAD